MSTLLPPKAPLLPNVSLPLGLEPPLLYSGRKSLVVPSSLLTSLRSYIFATLLCPLMEANFPPHLHLTIDFSTSCRGLPIEVFLNFQG